MGLRPHFAKLLNPRGALHPRMALVVEGFGQLTIAVKSGWWSVEAKVERMSMLGWSNDVHLVAFPPRGRWPAGTLSVDLRAYQTSSVVQLEVGEDVPVPLPSFDFQTRALAPPAPATPPPGLSAPGPAPFYIPGPTQAQIFLGVVGGSGPMVELHAFLSNGQALGGWVRAGASATADYTPPPQGVSLVGAIVRDLLGQHVVYGEVPLAVVAHYTAPRG